MDKPTAHDKLLIQVRQLLPDIVRANDDQNREETQTVVWLVGLAAGFLGVLAAKPEILFALGKIRPYLIPSLAAVAVSGLAERLCQQVAARKERYAVFNVNMYLWAYTEPFDQPLRVQEWWTEQEILQRLRDDFGMDYSFLSRYNVPIEGYREAYQGQYELWEKAESEKAEHIADLMAAIGGNDAPPKPTESAEADAISQIRARAKSIKRWNRAAAVLYWTTCGIFVAGTGMLATALLR